MKILFIFTLPLIFLITIITEFYLKNSGLGDPVRYDSNIFYGYSPKENQKRERFKGSFVTINDVGLRTLDNWNNNKKKIVFLGDSVTYGGSSIDDKDLFSHIVCEKLSEYLCGNAGVNSYGVYNTVMRSRFDKRIQNADFFIFLFPPDDFLRNFRGKDTAHFYLNNKNYLLPAMTEAINFISTKFDLNKYISKSNDTVSNINDKLSYIDYSVELLSNEIKSKIIENKNIIVFLSNRKDDKFFKNRINEYIKKLVDNIDIIILDDVLDKDEYFFDHSVHLSKKGSFSCCRQNSKSNRKLLVN